MLKLINFPRMVLLSLMIRVLVLGANLSDAMIILALCGLEAYYQYLKPIKYQDMNKEVKDRLVELEEQHKLMKDKVSALTLSNSFKR